MYLLYTDCYAINPMQYCQELKGRLLKQGVRIYEFTHIYKLEKHYATANLGGIRFKQAIVCPGKAEDEIFPGHARHTYGIQNFITISEPLSETQIKAMMPSGECMCRDTNLVFTYYRLTGDRRIVLGGGNPVSSFFPRDLLYDSTIASVIRGFKHMFPPLREVTFPQYRSGRIQASRDLMPLIGPSHRFSNQIRVQGAVGLPRAASSGTFAVDLLHNEADNELLQVFGYERTFFIPLLSSSRLLKTAIFGLSHAKVMGLF